LLARVRLAFANVLDGMQLLQLEISTPITPVLKNVYINTILALLRLLVFQST